jgi:hypothetical protein
LLRLSALATLNLLYPEWDLGLRTFNADDSGVTEYPLTVEADLSRLIPTLSRL